MSRSSDRDAILIVGAGLAGLFLALKLAPRKAIVLSPAPLGQASASAWAQGGLAAALSPEDNPALHADDTVNAGAGLVDPVVAQLIAEEGPSRVLDLIALGVPFDRTANGALALSLEAAHSRPRVARVAGDLAGKAIMDALIAAARAAAHIHVIEGARAVALVQDDHGRVRGALVRDSYGERIIHASETVFATGGIGGLYAVTTNPKTAIGAGVAMAYRAGALIADPEFVQFHPTAIAIDRDPAPRATEALRGEGAKLVNADGKPFMERYHPAGELAPRDVVARAIHRERVYERGAFLDARVAVGDHFPEHFPTVFAACMSAGVDPRTSLIPVAPAAHYHMGGIVSDLWGKSTLDGLSVVGECASTGAHGANRLASNSLLEAVVFAQRIADRLRDSEAPVDAASATPEAPPILPLETHSELRALMQADAGVDRDAHCLKRASHFIDQKLNEFGSAHTLVSASLVVTAALAREESRGAHYRSDFPYASEPKRTFCDERHDSSVA
ncbi:MAG: L-aspartate oxidase [Caulobacterales bacterium]